MSAVADLMPVVASQFTTDTRIDAVAALAAMRVTASTFGTRYVEAMTQLTAHILTLLDRAATQAAAGGTVAVGAVTSESAGDLSVSYGGVANVAAIVSTAVDAELAQTPYGLAFMAIRNSRVAARAYAVRL